MALIEIYQGDARTLALNFTYADGTPINVSGYSIFLGVKQTYTDGLLIFAGATGTAPDAVTGLINLPLTSAQTNQCPGDYLADFALYDLQTGKTTVPTDGLRILPTTIP